MKPPGLASVSSAVSRSNGRPCQVHALYKLTSALSFEKTTANTVSRWETATYKPSIAGRDVLARFFEEVTLYARFRRVHRAKRKA
jgi:hypothetical protein